MSSVSPDLSAYLQRGFDILRASPALFPPGAPALVDVLLQEPPVEQAPQEGLLPIVYVGYSKNPYRDQRYVGRDSPDAIGARMWVIEFYNVIIVRELTQQMAMAGCQRLSAIIRDAYQRNSKLKEPATLTGPLCAYSDTFMTPYVLRDTNKEVQAINVVVRPHVLFSQRPQS